ncbi:DUF2726 domain-containing protein [Aquincola sp. MAHUQ-54]|uniref:DUF2726 domain-containing protein n=1 Tax=Aquincola agrisoli TaxID=3119538 RepID=A0AAW9QJ00_9BURK
MEQSFPWFLAWTAVLSVIVLLAVAVHRHRVARRRETLPTDWPLAPRPVFSAEERRVYRQLREALPGHVVLSKLPLLRFCQPNDPQRLRYWFDLLGTLHVSFAICSASGRVLAVIDLETSASNSRRGQRIKESVLTACQVPYLRCAPDELPTIPELQLMVPAAAGTPAAAPAPRPSSTEPRHTVWPESHGFTYSFLCGRRRSIWPPEQDDPPPRNGTTGR